MGFPGDDAVEMEVPAIIGGTLVNCRLDELDERCRSMDDETESDNAAWESRMRWYLDSCAVVRLMDASRVALSLRLKLLSSFFCSRSFKKSEMFSSSVFMDPELVPVTSLMTSEPRCCEEEALPLPLLRLSSSVLLPPPEENLLRLWPKLLL